MDVEHRFRLDGKTALVTGASYGLGALFAAVLADAGADVVLTARSLDKLRDTAAAVEARGRRVVVAAGDICRFEDCQAVVDHALAEVGRIDVLVNNAGWSDDRLIRTEHVEPEIFQQMVMTDLVGLFFMTRAAAPAMLAAGGGGRQHHQPVVHLRDGGLGEPDGGLLRGQGRGEQPHQAAGVRVG